MSRRVVSPVTAHRRRLAENAVSRLELYVAKEDIPLLRQVAAALSDPRRRTDARRLIENRFSEPKVDLKALLAATPFDLDLGRESDSGRDVEF